MEQDVTPWRVVQLTDSHLFADDHRRLQGMNTRESFFAVVDLVRAEQSAIDLILGTGDIAQDGSEEAYRLFHDTAASLCSDMVWVPGNHDEADDMANLSFAQANYRKVIDNEHWRIIMLDSSVSKSVHGFLEAEELATLQEALRTAGDRHVLIALHHHPIPSECTWLDNHNLKNTDEFHQLVKAHPQVKAILWGHIHQQVDKVIDGIHYLATPSTCIQFAPQQVDFKLDSAPPGYRWLELYPNGDLKTDVSRVSVSLEVDLTGSGY